MDTALKNHIAAVIRASRKAKKLTQEEVADRIQRTPESLSNLERGQAAPSVETLVALCRELEIDANVVLDFKNDGMEVPANKHHLMQELHQIIKRLDEDTLELARSQLQALLDFQSKS